MLANAALSYAAAGIVTLAFMVIQNLVAPSPFPGLLEMWIFGVSLLAVGSPAVLIVLAIVDLVLTASRSQRRDAFVFALLPAALAALLIVPYPAILPVVVWLGAVGLLVGWVMRLPKRAPVVEPTR